MRRLLLVAVLAALMVMASAGAAFAGEWNSGDGYIHGDDDTALNSAASDCSYSGLDDPDPEDASGGKPPRLAAECSPPVSSCSARPVSVPVCRVLPAIQTGAAEGTGEGVITP